MIKALQHRAPMTDDRNRETFIALKATHTAHRIATLVANPSTDGLVEAERLEKIRREHLDQAMPALPLHWTPPTPPDALTASKLPPVDRGPLPVLPEFLRQSTQPGGLTPDDEYEMYVVLLIILVLAGLLAWLAMAFLS